MSPFGNVWARYSMLFPPTFALPQKVPVREAFLAISSISLPIVDSTTPWVKPVPMRCRAPWPNVIRRPSSLCHPQSFQQGRKVSHPAKLAGPWRAAVLAADVVFELFDDELLLGNNRLDEIANRDDAD